MMKTQEERDKEFLRLHEMTLSDNEYTAALGRLLKVVSPQTDDFLYSELENDVHGAVLLSVLTQFYLQKVLSLDSAYDFQLIDDSFHEMLKKALSGAKKELLEALAKEESDDGA